MLRDAILRTQVWQVHSVLRNIQIGTKRLDAVCRLVSAGGERSLLIAYKRSGYPGTIRATASMLRSLRRASGNADAMCVFAAPYVSSDGLDVCAEEEIACIDEAGNLLLPLPGAYVEIRGRGNAHPEKRELRSLFSPKSSRILRIMLAQPDRQWQVQELARTAGVSAGLVSRLKSPLREEDLIVDVEGRLVLRSASRMLSLWSSRYSYRRNARKEYFTLDDAATFEQRIARWCEGADVRHAFGLFSAADRLAPHVRMNKSFAFVDEEPARVAAELDLKPVSSGANVMLLRPFDIGVFFDSIVISGLRVTSDIQTYLDLRSHRGRGEEAAEFLLKRVIEPRWEVRPSQ